jgi:hypothetical protein
MIAEITINGKIKSEIEIIIVASQDAYDNITDSLQDYIKDWRKIYKNTTIETIVIRNKKNIIIYKLG